MRQRPILFPLGIYPRFATVTVRVSGFVLANPDMKKYRNHFRSPAEKLRKDHFKSLAHDYPRAQV
jgi:hypothetical protein